MKFFPIFNAAFAGFFIFAGILGLRDHHEYWLVPLVIGLLLGSIAVLQQIYVVRQSSNDQS